MADIFISYKKEDRALTQEIVDRLSRLGFSTWWDDRLTPEANWDRAIEQEIEAAGCVLVLWTERSVVSDWVRVEANFALQNRKLVQASFGACKIPLAFTLQQRLEFAAASADTLDDERWERLVSWIRLFVDKKPPPAAPETRVSAAQKRRQVVEELRAREGASRFGSLTVDPQTGDLSLPVELTLRELFAGFEALTLPDEVSAGRKINVRVPAGLEEGTRLRLAGEGRASAGGVHGDLYLVFGPRYHANDAFRLDGRDLWVKLGVPAAILSEGGPVRVSLPNDKVLEARAPANTRDGQVLRIRGEGLRGPGGVAGDLYIELERGPDFGVTTGIASRFL